MPGSRGRNGRGADRPRAASPAARLGPRVYVSRKPGAAGAIDGAPHDGSRLPSLIMAASVCAAAAAFGVHAPPSGRAAAGADTAAYFTGLGYSALALVGSTAVGSLRKIASARGVGSAEQVGVACLVQGIVAVLHCLHTGDIGGPASPLPSARFWLAASGASALLVLVKTLETKAYAESDITLCAPFLAFDPVMQLIVGMVFMPLLCPRLGLGCEDAAATYPLHHLLALVCIGMGAFFLGSSLNAGESRVKGKQIASSRLGPLPRGSCYILFNCFIYGFTSRMDRVAIASSGKTVYYAWGRLIMAGTALGGLAASGGLTGTALRKLSSPVSMLLVGMTCLADALYQLSQYQAMAHISPVYVTAIKRGGGILLSSLIGVLLFRESVLGRLIPILTIVVGVVLLCL